MSPLLDLHKLAVESGLLGRPAPPAMAKEKFYSDKSVLFCTPQLSSAAGRWQAGEARAG
jgi:hypothetical protein